MNRITEFRKHVYKCLDKAHELYNIYDIFPKENIGIKFYTKGEVAGTASYKKCGDKLVHMQLSFNATFIQSDWNYLVNDTIPHEVAHLVTYCLYNDNIYHSQKWIDICIALGGSGNRFHSIKVDKKKSLFYQYDINGMIVNIKPAFHRKIQRSFANVPLYGRVMRIHKHQYKGIFIYE